MNRSTILPYVDFNKMHDKQNDTEGTLLKVNAAKKNFHSQIITDPF